MAASVLRIRAGGLTLVATAVALLVLVASADARTIKVPQQQPTIQDAVDAAVPGDRILVKARQRRYIENVEVTTNRLVIVGEIRPVGQPRSNRFRMPLVDGTSLGGVDDQVFDIDADNVTLRRLMIQHGNGVECTGERCHMDQVRVRMSDQSGDCIEIDGNRGRVERSHFRGCDTNAIDIDGNRGKVLHNVIGQVDSDCVIVDGNGARIHNNRIRNCEDAEGVELDGDLGQVTHNLAKSTDGNGFEIDGANNLVKRNRAVNIEDDCYEIDGIRPRVFKNRARGCDGGFEIDAENMQVWRNVGVLVGDDVGFDISCTDETGGAAPANVCAQAVIAGNFASDNNNDDEGYEIDDFTGDGGLVISDNVSHRNNDGGYDIDVDDSRIEGNISRRDGAEGNEPGIEINGDGNVIVGNDAATSGEHGLEIDGDGNVIRRNLSRLANVDGLNVDGTGSLVKLNRAINNAGDGIENDGDATRLIRNESRGNRRDCANDGTIAVKRRNRCADGSNFNGPGTLDRPLPRNR